MTETAGARTRHDQSGDLADATPPDRDTAEEVVFRRTVGKRIRVWRVLHDLSQDDLARSAGVTRNFVRVKFC